MSKSINYVALVWYTFSCFVVLLYEKKTPKKEKITLSAILSLSSHAILVFDHCHACLVSVD